MKRRLHLALLLLLAVVAQVTYAQAPEATPEEAVTALLNRIGGNGTADKIKFVIDASLAKNGKDVFVITSQDGKPCIKGNNQLSVTTGINWYLNHHAHINLTWNQLTTDLSEVSLPTPATEETHESTAKYRYNFNTCTFSYSMAFWTWERWQQEIDWMALHGINAPLNLVGLDVVTRKFLKELGVSDSDINAYIAGPGFIAWFAMNNLEGWGGTINSPSTGVDMSGNPDWWYTRQEQLCRNMLQRMRELGMQPVIPGFSGQVPNCIVNYSIKGFSSGDVVNNGTWAGGFTRPDILKPNTESYRTFAAVYYKHLHEVMGVSELYSIDPFHEGSLPSGVSNETCYPNIMEELDVYYNGVSQEDKAKYNVDEQPKWMIQYWQGVPQSGAFSAMSSYGDRFIGLDLFADNIYAGNAAKWKTDYYQGRPYIYCMLHNFGGRSGLHGRLETTLNGYFEAMAKNNNCQGIGATPEGTETNPILYDMLFELPWMDSQPSVDTWLEDYAHARYGIENEKTLEAMKLLKRSVWDCKVNQQGTSEAVILARPNWTIGSVSSWSTSAIYWDTQDVLMAADLLVSAEEIIESAAGKDNYNYDVIDVIRQSMVDYAAQLLPLINAARGNTAEYTRLYQLYLQLMLDLDKMLSYDENFKLERWTSLARNIADEVKGTTENDRNWLEWNARTQVTVWSNGNTDLHDYSNRCWAGLIKDFHYKRWKHFFENNGNAPSGGWFSGFEYPWTVDFNETYNLAGDYSKVVIPTDMSATEKAVQTFGKYFGRVKGATKNYIFPMGIATNATKSDVIPEVYRGKPTELPLVIGKDVTIASVWVDLNADGNAGSGETLTADGNNITIPADAKIGKTKAQVVFSDGTDITFSLALVEDITEARTVTAVAGANGSVAIEGTNELSITNTEAVKMTATANTGYNFKDWTDANDSVVSNDNPFIYYGKEAATFTANFIQDKWGVVACNGTFSSDIAGYSQFIHNLTFAYYNREAETIWETTTAPTEIFNTIPQIVNIPQGASFTVNYDNGNKDGLKYCYFRAFIDLNADGDFDDEGELLKETGTNGAVNTAVCGGSINVVLPYDAPLGITHMRLRFDGAWDNNNNPSGRGAKDASIRPVYEIVINVTEKSDKAATINVKTNSKDWGTVEVWTDETPDGSTGTEWVVSANIPMYLRATKASEDVEFLGWYDHYGRLLTNELEYTMYAREDATYTAKFRKALDIDGWQFEYRTEPGSEIVTNKLANGVKPEAGKTYYIYADVKQTNETYVARYLYDNGGTLATNTSIGDDNYLWTCIVNDDNTYSFRNASGKYLANDGSFDLSIGETPAQYSFAAAVHEGVSLLNATKGYTGSKYMVTKVDGTDFNHNDGARNDGNWSADYVFTEVSTSDVVIFTNVRESGDHDLDIPETVEILGEQCKIVGFDNGVFNNNKDLWSITMPKSMEFLSEKSLFSHTLTGNGNTQTFDVDIKNNEGWTITMDVKRTGELTGWGSCLIASGSNPAKPDGSNYAEGFQFYLQSPNNPNNKTENDKLIIKTKTQVNDSWYFDDIYQEASFKVIITYNGAQQLSVNVLKADGTNATNHDGKQEPIVFTDCTIQDITQLCTNVQSTITANVKIDKTAEANPFSGCSNLGSIAFSEACANYYVAQDGDLYNSSNVLICSPEGKNKADAIRTLGELIDNTKALMDVIATSIDPIGKVTEIALSTTEGDNYYIWCNAPQTGDEGNVGRLLDNTSSTFFHSNWESTTPPADGLDHHLTIEKVEGIETLKFHYQARTGSGLGDYPKTIKVQGSNNGTDYTDIAIVQPRNANGGTIENGAEWTSEKIGNGNRYAYLRFMVTATTTNKNKDGHIYWHMAEFDLFKLTSLVEVAPVYKNLAGITNEEAANVYDNLVNALYVYNNGGTAEEMQAAYDALEPLYTALNKKKNKVLNGVYHIKFGGAPIFVAHSQALDGLTGAGNPGYRLFDATTTNTNSGNNNKRLQDEAIAAKAAGDELFTIVPNSDITGYTISAQGLYMQTTGVPSQWSVQYFDTDEAKAGVYLIEDVSEDVFKLKSNKSGTQYVNDWGPVFGNDNSNKEGLSTFSFSPVTEYSLTVPASGVTTLCLPFNVVLPEGVTAYEANLDKKKNYTGYALETVASAGETLARNTPVIIKANAKDYTLTITMDEEGAKHATEGNVLRSGLIKTTVPAANTKYTFDGENFNVITASTEVAANQCWMELSENCGPVIYGSAPAYILTTDEANPILYKIIIKRAEDGSKVLQYDEPTSNKIKIVDVAGNKSYQAWYFMQGSNGLLIKPYNADGKVLTVENTSDGVGKAMISPITTGWYQEWDITKSTVNGCTDYYYIKVNGTSNAVFSHNGGFDKGSYMGIWSGGWNSNDGGSLFKIEEVTFSNDNPRFYQLSDVRAALTDGADIPSGTGVGLYSNVEAYRDACETASTLINAGNTSSSADCYAAYKELRTTKAAITYNEPDENKFYVIKSVANNDYCKDKLVRTSYEPAEHDGSTGTKYDHRHLVFDAANAIPQQSLAVFQFENTGTKGEYRMKNLHTGLYVKSFTQNAEHMGAEADAQPVAISGYADGAVTLKVGNSDPMHAQDTHDVIVTYGAEPGNASLWSITETADIKYQASVSSVGYSTLYLNYPVSIPAGVTAYEVGTIQNNMLMMQEVENTIPARTGVVLRGNAGTYNFALAETANANRLTAILSGTLYKQTMEKEVGSKYYVLSYIDTTDDKVSNPEVGFYQAVLGNDSAKFSNAANKAYLQVSETNGEARDAFLAFNFDYDDVETDIAETEDGYAEGEKPVIFDLQGRRVLNPRKPGMYIVNGKKTVIK